MACRNCNDSTVDSIMRAIAWTIFIAPVAYVAYKVLDDAKAVDKLKKATNPYLKPVKEYVKPYANTVAEEIEKATESLKSKHDKAVEFLKENFDSIADDAKTTAEKVIQND